MALWTRALRRCEWDALVTGTCASNLHAALWTRAVLSPFPGAVFSFAWRLFFYACGAVVALAPFFLLHGAFFSFACAVLGACECRRRLSYLLNTLFKRTAAQQGICTQMNLARK